MMLFWIVRLEGFHSVKEIPMRRDAMDTMTVRSLHGYEISIYCQARQYRQLYKKWFVPDRIATSYRIFSNVSSDAPERLKEVCELELTFPVMYFKTGNEYSQKEKAITAYLDLLIKKLRDEELAA